MKLTTESQNTLTLTADDVLMAIRLYAGRVLGVAAPPADLVVRTAFPDEIVLTWSGCQTLPPDNRPVPDPVADAPTTRVNF